MTKRSALSPRFPVLGLLMSGPMHGYELHQEYQQALSNIWRAGISNVYAVLGELERLGYLESSLESQLGRPDRKILRITREGKNAFLDWLKGPVPNLRDVRILFLTKLFFFDRLGTPGVDDLIEAQKKVFLEQQLRLVEQQSKSAEGSFGKLVLGFRLHQLRAMTEWLDQVSVDLGVSHEVVDSE